MERRKSRSWADQAGAAWWGDVPLATAPYLPRFATTLTDGLYLLRSRWLSVGAPAAALLVGLLYGWLHEGPTFTRSIVALAVLFAIGLLSINLGWCAWIGYLLGDIFLNNEAVSSFGSYGFVENAIRQGGSTFISYLVLAILLMGIPTIALTVRLGISESLKRISAAPAIAVVVAAAVAGYLAYAWAQTSAALIRPVFTWLGTQPDTEDIFALQDRGAVLAAAGVLFVLVRVLLEPRLTNDRVTRVAQRLLVQLPAAVARSRARGGFVGPVVRTVLVAGLLTLLLAGLISSFLEGIVVWILFTLLYLLREVIGRIPGWNVVAKVPAILRLLIALAISYPLMASYMESAYSGTSSLQPVLVTACIGIALAVLATASPAAKPAATPMRSAAT